MASFPSRTLANRLNKKQLSRKIAIAEKLCSFKKSKDTNDSDDIKYQQ